MEVAHKMYGSALHVMYKLDNGHIMSAAEELQEALNSLHPTTPTKEADGTS